MRHSVTIYLILALLTACGGGGNVNTEPTVASATGGSSIDTGIQLKTNAGGILNGVVGTTPSTPVDLTSVVEGGSGNYDCKIIQGAGTEEDCVYTPPATSEEAIIEMTDTETGDSEDITVETVVPPTLAVVGGDTDLPAGGTVDVTPSNGKTPYTYEITSQTTGGSSVSSSGTVTLGNTHASNTNTVVVEVTDGFGNTDSVSIDVRPDLVENNSAQYVNNSSTVAVDFGGGDGAITCSVVSGPGTINGACDTVTSIGNGTIVVNAQDGNGDSVTINIVSATPPTIDAPGSDTDLSYNAGSVTLTVADGFGSESFSIVSQTNGAATIDASTGELTLDNAGGADNVITVRVTDAAGNTDDVVITVRDQIDPNPTSSNIANGGSTAFSPTGGDGSYTCSVVSGPGTVNNPTCNQITSTGASGDIVVRVTDSNGDSEDITITAYTAPSLDTSDSDLDIPLDGSTVTMSLSNGLGPFSYSKVSDTTGESTVDPTTGEVTPGNTSGSDSTVVVRVTDANANTSDVTLTIRPDLTETTGNTTVTDGGNIAIAFSGGDGSITCSVTSGPGTVNNPTCTQVTSSGGAGTIVVQATDGNGDTVSTSITVSSPVTIADTDDTVDASVTTDLSTYTSGGVGSLTFSIDDDPRSVCSLSGTGNKDLDFSGSGWCDIEVTDSGANTDTIRIYATGYGAEVIGQAPTLIDTYQRTNNENTIAHQINFDDNGDLIVYASSDNVPGNGNSRWHIFKYNTTTDDSQSQVYFNTSSVSANAHCGLTTASGAQITAGLWLVDGATNASMRIARTTNDWSSETEVYNGNPNGGRQSRCVNMQQDSTTGFIYMVGWEGVGGSAWNDYGNFDLYDFTLVSFDDGVNWHHLSSYHKGGVWEFNQTWDLALHEGNYLYVTGINYDLQATNTSEGYIRRIDISGLSGAGDIPGVTDEIVWEEVVAGAGTFLVSIDVNSSGHVYAGGYSETATNASFIIKSTTGNNGTYSTVDSGYTYAAQKTRIRDIIIDEDDNIYAGLDIIYANNTSRTAIRRSRDDGATWDTPYTYPDIGGGTTMYSMLTEDLVFDDQGNLYQSTSYYSSSGTNQTSALILRWETN